MIVPENVSLTIPVLLKTAAPGFQLPATFMLSDSWLAVHRLVWPVRGSSNEVVTNRPLSVSLCRVSWKKKKRHFEQICGDCCRQLLDHMWSHSRALWKEMQHFGWLKCFVCVAVFFCFNEQSGKAKKQTNQPLTANSSKQSHSETTWQPQNT